MKTKKVDRVDLSASSFAYVGDPEDTSTWKLPIHFPGDEEKTVNHIKNALYRFDTAHGIPDDEYISTWFTLCGAAIAHGISVDRTKVAPKSDAPKPIPPVAAPTPPVKAEVKTKKDLELEALIVMADRQAEAMLRAMGWE